MASSLFTGLIVMVSVATASGQVTLSLGTIPLPNNSVVVITDIGDEATGGSPLICTTTFRPCCGTFPNRHGQWYYPDGRQVAVERVMEDFYRNRGDDGTVRLHRRNNTLSPNGTYFCEIPLNSATDRQRLTVTASVFSSVSLTPSGTPTAGEQYRLNCRVTGTTDTPTFTWLGPPSNTPLPSDTRNVSGVMSSGSTHTSILQFDPIQTPDAGLYACQVEVDGETVITSTQVNVEEPVITAMVSASGTPTVGQSYSLTCTVTGADRLNPTITYLWFKDNTVVSGETQSTLSFSSLSLSDAGQYRCDITVNSTFLSQSITVMSNTQDLTLQIPHPTVTVTASPDGTIFTGSSLTLTCTIDLSEAVDIAVTVSTVWSGPSGTQFTTTTSVATRMTNTTYTSTATLSSVRSSSSGEYTCTVTVSSTSSFVNDSEARPGMTTVKVVDVSLTPSGTPTAGEQYQLNCTVTGSTFTPTFTWLGPPSNTPLPRDTRMVSGVMSSGSTHTSILQLDPIQSSHEGMYTCQVIVGTVTEMRSTQVNVDEPVITAMVSASGTPTVGQGYSLTCTVTGADRLNPTVTYQWFKDSTVVSGETQSTLSFSSPSLSDSGQYRCDATVSSTFLSQSITAQSNVPELRTFATIFQIRLNGILACVQWVSVDAVHKTNEIITILVEAVEQACECGFTRGHITEDAFQCFSESQQHVTFRARLTEISQATAPQLITHIEQWAVSTRTIPIRGIRLGINNTCSIVIENFDSPECPMSATTSESTTTPNPTISSTTYTTPLPDTIPLSSNLTGMIAGATVGVVLIALAAVAGAVIATVCVLKKRRKTYQTTSKSQTELPPAPVEATHYELRDIHHAHEYENVNKMTSGELYEEIVPQQQTTVYTQCPAYAPTTTAVIMATKGEPPRRE